MSAEWVGVKPEEEGPPKGCLTGCIVAVIAVVGLVAAMFAALFYFGVMQRGGVYDGLRVRMAESLLNELVPYIELHRTQHGAYPESLEELSASLPDGVTVFIHDPTIRNEGDFVSQTTFYYKRIDDAHYVLRGVGVDGVPFTDDDIVPREFPNTGLLLTPPASEPAPAVDAPPPVNEAPPPVETSPAP